MHFLDDGYLATIDVSMRSLIRFFTGAIGPGHRFTSKDFDALRSFLKRESCRAHATFAGKRRNSCLGGRFSPARLGNDPRRGGVPAPRYPEWKDDGGLRHVKLEGAWRL